MKMKELELFAFIMFREYTSLYLIFLCELENGYKVKIG